MEEPIEIMIKKDIEIEKKETYDETQTKKILLYIDISILFLFIVRLLNNYKIKETSIWYIATFYIITIIILIYNLYRKKYIKQSLIVNAIIFSFMISEGFISIYLSFVHKEVSSFILTSLTILLGINGTYFSKKYFSK